MKVIITKGAFINKTGVAVPSRAIGPINNRQFLVLVRLDNGSGTIELPLDATKNI